MFMLWLNDMCTQRDLDSSTSVDFAMLDVCATSTVARGAAPFIMDAGSKVDDACCDGSGGGWVPTTSRQGRDNSECGGETPGSCMANNMHHWDAVASCAGTAAPMHWQQQLLHSKDGLPPMGDTHSLTKTHDLANLPPRSVQLLTGHPWVVEHVLPLLAGAEQCKELGRQVLDALGAFSYSSLQGRDLQASKAPVMAYIRMWRLVDACAAVCHKVSGIAEVSFTLIKDNCWSQWVQGGGNRARMVSNKLKQTRRAAAMEGLAAAVLFMEKAYVGVQHDMGLENAVFVVEGQLKVVADHLWDRTVTSRHVQAALKQMQGQVDKMAQWCHYAHGKVS